MSCSAQNVLVSPVNVLWQVEAQFTVDFADATAAGLGGKYITFYLPTGVGYYAWFDENNTDVDPAPATFTEIEVDYAASATATAIATAFQSAVDAVSGFTAVRSGTVVTVTCDDVGEVTSPDDGTANTLVDIVVCKQGKDVDLGLLQGDVELSFSPANFIVQAHQTGVTPRAALFQGIETLEVTTTLLETTHDDLEEIYKIYGGSVTGGTSTVFGVGSSKQGVNLLRYAARLTLRPVNAGSDYTKDVNLMLALPVPDSLVYSGENPRTLSVTWQGYMDDAVDSDASALLFGDAQQSGIYT